MMAAQVENPSGPSDQLQQFISQMRELIAESELYICTFEHIEDKEESCALEGSQSRHIHLNDLIERHVIATEVVERQLHQVNLQTSKLLSSYELKKKDYEEKLEKGVKGLKEKLQLMKVHVDVIGVLLAERAGFEAAFLYNQEVLCLKKEGVNELSCELKASRDHLENCDGIGCFHTTSLSAESDTGEASDPHLGCTASLEDIGTQNVFIKIEVDQYEPSEGGMKVEGRTSHLLDKQETDEEMISDVCQDFQVERDCNDMDDYPEKMSRSNKGSAKRSSEKRVTCETCGKSCQSRSELVIHERTHTGEKPFTCDICGKGFTSQRPLTMHMRIHTGEKPFKCEVCGKSFIRLPTLTQHMMMHSGERPYTCDVCGKTFARTDVLNKHKLIHTGEKPYTCEVCGRGFRQDSGLTIHMRTHTGEKPFTCDICGKLFRQRIALTEHTRTHTGERPYACEICGKMFPQTTSLVYHMRTHTGEKPYTCDVCGEKFRSSSGLTTHKKSHSSERPYTCNICEMGFKKSELLKRHMRTHSDERPFTCDICGKGFKHDVTLTYHIRTHTGEKPYTCDVCGKSFKVSGCLTVHKRTHNKDLE